MCVRMFALLLSPSQCHVRLAVVAFTMSCSPCCCRLHNAPPPTLTTTATTTTHHHHSPFTTTTTTTTTHHSSQQPPTPPPPFTTATTNTILTTPHHLFAELAHANVLQQQHPTPRLSSPAVSNERSTCRLQQAQPPPSDHQHHDPPLTAIRGTCDGAAHTRRVRSRASHLRVDDPRQPQRVRHCHLVAE
jgi:hypothetical protein